MAGLCRASNCRCSQPMALATVSLLPTCNLTFPKLLKSNRDQFKFKTPPLFIAFSLTRLCSNMNEIMQTHAQMIKNGVIKDDLALNRLVSFCSLSDSGELSYARSLVLYHCNAVNTFAWNTLIRGYNLCEMPQEAIILYIEAMQRCVPPDRFTFPILAKACSLLLAAEEGRQIHAQIVKQGFDSEAYSRNSVIHLYAKCGCLGLARQLFDKSQELDVVSWTAMVTGYAREGDLETASQLFDEMPERNIVSWTAMISGYASEGNLDAARQLYDKMPERDIVASTAIINGYLQANCFKESLALFRELQHHEITLDRVILIGVLSACASLGALEQGEWIHAYIRKKEIKLDARLGTSLIDMYSKCGSIERAMEVFRRLTDKVLCSWNSMIAGLAMHGQARSAINLFAEMAKTAIGADDITFIGVLNACAHAGLVDEGKKYFHLMKEDYKIAPALEHYGCMVHLLARADLLVEAEELIESMPIMPDAVIWGTLAAACRIHGNAKLGERAGRCLLEMEPNDGARYVLLSNIYAMDARWDKVAELRQAMKERRIAKTPGCTSINLNGAVHEFVAGDTRHSQSKSMYRMLGKVFEDLKSEGYSPNTSKVFLDIEDETKESSVAYHSEKLAVAFGLLNTSSGSVIRIVKNQRFCEECHQFMKHISAFYNREIIARDRMRFHSFKHGLCSCMDFW